VQEATEELNRKVVFIGSGDLSHKLKINGPYGFAPEGPAFDKLITDILESGDFDMLLSIDQQLSEKAAECGLRSFAMMAGALDGKDIEKELLSYEGPFGVGYAVMAYAVTADNPNRRFAEKEAKRLESEIEDIRVNEDEFVRLARMSLEYYQKNHKHLPKPSNIGVDLLSKKGGVFVSIKLDGQLRGCIGTIAATTDSLADEIIQNAVSAGFRDPRFDHVSKSELARLVYSVDVLEKAEQVSSMLDLDPKRYGIIVRCKGKSGLLLPDLEGVDTPEEQLKIALRKGNISPEDDYQLERFVVTRHH
ncbi:MAG: AmmeMemoRadiSam system protein A, partial [Candidatus Izemoplasmatales bacterium]|nr:AmmeMemoRadiSam system protein A [Candidatus Izemoplasmatales bacterium]